MYMENKQWDINYKNNLEINKYPFDALVSFWFNYKYLLKFDKNINIKVCELGCGCGNNLAFFAENNCDVYGIDISETAIEYSEKLFKKKNLKGVFKVGNLINHDFENNFFDIVIDRGCFTHNPGFINKCIEISHNILKKDGLFFSMTFTKNHHLLKDTDKIIINEYYFYKNKNHPWYNLHVNTLNENEILILYEKFHLIDYNIINVKNINNNIIEYIYIILQK